MSIILTVRVRKTLCLISLALLIGIPWALKSSPIPVDSETLNSTQEELRQQFISEKKAQLGNLLPKIVATTAEGKPIYQYPRGVLSFDLQLPEWYLDGEIYLSKNEDSQVRELSLIEPAPVYFWIDRKITLSAHESLNDGLFYLIVTSLFFLSFITLSYHISKKILPITNFLTITVLPLVATEISMGTTDLTFLDCWPVYQLITLITFCFYYTYLPFLNNTEKVTAQTKTETAT